MSTTVFPELRLNERVAGGPERQQEKAKEHASLLPAVDLAPADSALIAKLEALRPVLNRTASAILRRHDDVDDAVQEAMLRLVRNADRFDPKKGSLAALARTTVRHVALNMLERLHPEPMNENAAPEARPSKPPLEAEEVRGHLRKAVDALPDAQRMAFLLVHQEGLSHKDVANELRISQETLRARLYRARMELRTLLKEFAP